MDMEMFQRAHERMRDTGQPWVLYERDGSQKICSLRIYNRLKLDFKGARRLAVVAKQKIC